MPRSAGLPKPSQHKGLSWCLQVATKGLNKVRASTAGGEVLELNETEK